MDLSEDAVAGAREPEPVAAGGARERHAGEPGGTHVEQVVVAVEPERRVVCTRRIVVGEERDRGDVVLVDVPVERDGRTEMRVEVWKTGDGWAADNVEACG